MNAKAKDMAMRARLVGRLVELVCGVCGLQTPAGGQGGDCGAVSAVRGGVAMTTDGAGVEGC